MRTPVNLRERPFVARRWVGDGLRCFLPTVLSVHKDMTGKLSDLLSVVVVARTAGGQLNEVFLACTTNYEAVVSLYVR